MTTPLDIVQIGNPLLRMVAKVVHSFDETLEKTVEEMVKTLETNNGIGLAAPQVGRSQQLFIIHMKPTINYPYLEERGPVAVVNPHIISVDDNIQEDREGCLSVPSLRALVPRHTKIEVSYFTTRGVQICQTLSDMHARVFQHEYDHLQGIFFLDRVIRRDSICTYEEWQKRK